MPTKRANHFFLCLPACFGRLFPASFARSGKSGARAEKLKALDKNCLYDLDCVLRTPESDREQAAFLYIRLLVLQGKSIRGMLAAPEVRRVRDLSDRVGQERHRLTGFLRFRETANGVFYAPCSPDNDVVELLMPHFAARFRTFPLSFMT